MNHSLIAKAGVLLLLLGGTGCYGLSSFSGDGRLSRSSRLSGRPMYTLDLGPVKLDRPGRHTFRFRGLPETEMVLGLQIQHFSAAPIWPADVKPIVADVRVTMVNEGNQTVLDSGGPLSNWTWSGSSDKPQESFVYFQGRMTEVPQKDGWSLTQRLDLKADGGWGTYFTPREPAVYTLTIDVSNPQASPTVLEATLVAQSYPWFG